MSELRRRIALRVKVIGAVTLGLVALSGFTNLGYYLGMNADPVPFGKSKAVPLPVCEPWQDSNPTAYGCMVPNRKD